MEKGTDISPHRSDGLTLAVFSSSQKHRNHLPNGLYLEWTEKTSQKRVFYKKGKIIQNLAYHTEERFFHFVCLEEKFPSIGKLKIVFSMQPLNSRMVLPTLHTASSLIWVSFCGWKGNIWYDGPCMVFTREKHVLHQLPSIGGSRLCIDFKDLQLSSEVSSSCSYRPSEPEIQLSLAYATYLKTREYTYSWLIQNTSHKDMLALILLKQSSHIEEIFCLDTFQEELVLKKLLKKLNLSLIRIPKDSLKISPLSPLDKLHENLDESLVENLYNYFVKKKLIFSRINY